MIKLYGSSAKTAAILKADGMLNRGNIDGYYAWNRIVAVIDDLGRKSIPGG
jgi:hypothetical protein